MIECTFAISTVSHYYPKTIPRLIQNLRDIGVDDSNIKVFVNEAYGSFEPVSGIEHHLSTDRTFFEWLAPKLIIEKNLKSEWWFLLHDTVEFTRNPMTSIQEKLETTDSRMVMLTPTLSNNMGLIHQSVFDTHAKRFTDMIDAISSIQIPRDRKSYIIHHENQFFAYDTCDHFQPRHSTTAEETVYDAPARIVETFDSVGLRKYKANYKGPNLVRDTI